MLMAFFYGFIWLVTSYCISSEKAQRRIRFSPFWNPFLPTLKTITYTCSTCCKVMKMKSVTAFGCCNSVSSLTGLLDLWRWVMLLQFLEAPRSPHQFLRIGKMIDLWILKGD